jgi:chromosome segregation ATPase
MFNSVIKHDVAALEKRVADLEKELSSALKALAFLKGQLTTTQPAEKKKKLRQRKNRRRHHDAKHLMYDNEGRVDIEKSLSAINRRAQDIMTGCWPRHSAESRIDHALRRSTPGAGGMISREQWISDNPEQLELWPR